MTYQFCATILDPNKEPLKLKTLFFPRLRWSKIKTANGVGDKMRFDRRSFSFAFDRLIYSFPPSFNENF